MKYKMYANWAVYLVEVTRFEMGYEAVTHRLPEDCYPAEPDEIEFTVISLEVDDEDSYDPTYDPEYDLDFCDRLIIEVKKGIKYLH